MMRVVLLGMWLLIMFILTYIALHLRGVVVSIVAVATARIVELADEASTLEGDIASLRMRIEEQRRQR